MSIAAQAQSQPKVVVARPPAMSSLTPVGCAKSPAALCYNHYGTIMVGEDVPTTLTLKNIPDDVYERLKASAAAHRRSLNGEAIVCLEKALKTNKVSVEERIERARELRAKLRTLGLTHDDIDAFKREGRP